MKRIIFTLCLALYAANAFAGLWPIGWYQTIDDKTGNPRSIVRLERDDDTDMTFGRIVALYDEKGNLSETMLAPERRASRIDGNPHVAGLDIIWGMESGTDRSGATELRGGRIMDPQSGRTYRATITRGADAGTIRVRGSLGPVGRTQTWRVLPASEVPEELRSLNTPSWRPATRD